MPKGLFDIFVILIFLLIMIKKNQLYTSCKSK